MPYSPGDEVWVRATFRGASANGLCAIVTFASDLFPGEPTPVSIDAKDFQRTEQSQDEASGCDFNASGKHTDDDDGDCPCGYKWPPVQAQPQDVASSAEEMPAALEPRAAASDAATAAHRYVQSVIDCADVWTEEWAENVFIAGWRQATLQAKSEPNRITGSLCDRHRSAVNSCEACS